MPRCLLARCTKRRYSTPQTAVSKRLFSNILRPVLSPDAQGCARMQREDACNHAGQPLNSFCARDAVLCGRSIHALSRESCPAGRPHHAQRPHAPDPGVVTFFPTLSSTYAEWVAVPEVCQKNARETGRTELPDFASLSVAGEVRGPGAAILAPGRSMPTMSNTNL